MFSESFYEQADHEYDKKADEQAEKMEQVYRSISNNLQKIFNSKETEKTSEEEKK